MFGRSTSIGSARSNNIDNNNKRSRTNSLRSNFQSFRARTKKESEPSETSPIIAPKYNSANSLELFLRLNASVWPSVLPWCIVNTAIACSVHITVDSNEYWDLSTKDKAHVFSKYTVHTELYCTSLVIGYYLLFIRKGTLTRVFKLQ